MALEVQDALVLLAAGVVPALTVVGVAVRMTWWLSRQFSELRKVTYSLDAKHDRRILRLEYWAVKQKNGFQPGLEVPGSANGSGA